MRVFLGCPVPPDVAREMAAWAALSFDPQVVRFVPIENLHITFAFYGEVDSETAEELASLTRKVQWRPLKVHSAGARFYGRNAIAIRVEGVLYAPKYGDLDELEFHQPDWLRPRDPDPHVTIARLRPGALAPALPSLAQNAFELDRLVLYQSVLSPNGSRYLPLAEANNDHAQGNANREDR